MTQPQAPHCQGRQSRLKKWAVAQFLEIPAPSPKQLEYSYSLAYEITHPYKNDILIPWGHSHLLRRPTLCLWNTVVLFRHQVETSLCNLIDCSMLSFPVLHHLLELAQTHVHWVGDAIQASQPVAPFSCLQSFPAPGSFPTSQIFPSGSQITGASASVLPVDTQGWFPLGLTGWISLLSKGLSRVFSSTIWKHQFFSAQPSLWRRSHSTRHWRNHSFAYSDCCWQSDVSAF